MTILHKQNYKKELGNTKLGFGTILAKMKRYGAQVKEVPERSIGIGSGYRQLSVFYKEEVLEVSKKVIADIEKLDNRDNYMEPWVKLRDYLTQE